MIVYDALLMDQLLGAGLPVLSVSPSGMVTYTRELTPAEQTTAQAIIAAHDPNALRAQDQAAKDAVAAYTTLPSWAKTTSAIDATNYINSQIWNGSTSATVNAYIDANIVNITAANVAQINSQLANIRAVLKLAAGAILAMRDLFIITAKLLIYIRDLVIRFRK